MAAATLRGAPAPAANRHRGQGGCRRGLAVVAPLLLLLSCAHAPRPLSPLILDVRAGACLNPPDGRCNEAGTDSRLLEVRLYQLKAAADPCRLEWDEFVEGRELERLKDLLADPQRADASTLRLTVVRNEIRQLPAWPRLPDASYLLIVAIGRNRGAGSIRLLSLAGSSGSQSLYFLGYDVCLGQRCDNQWNGRCP